jgi:hypothetical protein
MTERRGSKKNSTPRFPLHWTQLLAIILMLVVALASPDWQEFRTVGTVMILALFFWPFLPYIPHWFEEISGMGFTLKTRRAIAVVQQRQLVNQVVSVPAIASWFWVDEAAVPHVLPDVETGQFLARQNGIIEIGLTDMESLKPVAPAPMPSIKSATPMRNENDIFILYNDTLYYQSSLSFLYRFAEWEGFDFRDKKITEDDWKIVKKLQPGDFLKHRIV